MMDNSFFSYERLRQLLLTFFAMLLLFAHAGAWELPSGFSGKHCGTHCENSISSSVISQAQNFVAQSFALCGASCDNCSSSSAVVITDSRQATSQNSRGNLAAVLFFPFWRIFQRMQEQCPKQMRVADLRVPLPFLSLWRTIFLRN